MRPVRSISLLALVLGGALLPGCGPHERCPDVGYCALLRVEAPGLGEVVLDRLEVLVRSAPGDDRRVKLFHERLLRLPTTIAVELPELAKARSASLSLRATWEDDHGQVTTLSAAVDKGADLPEQSEHRALLSRPCEGGPCLGPVPRRGAALAYDPGLSRVVLFGGVTEDGTLLGDTWEWDGAGWRAVTTSAAPSPRYGHSMAFDPQGGHLVLFGGLGFGDSPSLGPQPLGETWRYLGAGTGWGRVASAGPPPRHHAALSTAPIAPGGRLGLLLYGGGGTQDAVLGDTWTWDGLSWQLRDQETAPCLNLGEGLLSRPQCRAGAALALVHTAAPQAVLIGGSVTPSGEVAPVFDDSVWRWDGARWYSAQVATPPAALQRTEHQLVALEKTQVMLLGGRWGGVRRRDAFVLDLSQGFFGPQLGPTPIGDGTEVAAFDEARLEVVMLGQGTFTYRQDQGWLRR